MRYFNDPFDDSFDRQNLLPNNLNFSYLWNSVVDYFLDDNWLFDFHDFFNVNRGLNQLGDFDNSLDDFLHDSWHFNDLLNDLFHLDYFLYHIVNILYHFNRNVNDFFNFLDLWHFDDFLYDLFDRNHLRNLNDSLNDLLNDLLDFNNFGNDSEDFKDIVDIDNSHNLLVDHSDDSFIHF